MNIVMPVCGESSRYPGVRPKWLLTHPEGNLMFIESIKGLVESAPVENVYLVAKKEHLEKYNCRAGLKKQFFRVFGTNVDLDIVELEFQTQSQPETVFEGIKDFSMEEGFVVKDCDNFFTIPDCDDLGQNFVTYYEVGESEKRKAFNKSYVEVEKNKKLKRIAEREIISNKICTGGYGFADKSDFIKGWKKVKKRSSDSEYHMSDVVQVLIEEGQDFNAFETPDFTDWGTLEDWRDFKSDFGTYFVDIDGCLVKNASEIFEPKWGESTPLQENINAINELYESGKAKVILTTARLSEYKEDTVDRLDDLGVKYHDIIFDLPHAKRYLINDYSGSNSYPTSVAVNVKRDSDELKHKI